MPKSRFFNILTRDAKIYPTRVTKEESAAKFSNIESSLGLYKSKNTHSKKTSSNTAVTGRVKGGGRKRRKCKTMKKKNCKKR